VRGQSELLCREFLSNFKGNSRLIKLRKRNSAIQNEKKQAKRNVVTNGNTE
jgi:hypothetical protein